MQEYFLLEWKCVLHLRRHIYPVISVSHIYTKISVYKIKIGTWMLLYFFPSANNGYEW